VTVELVEVEPGKWRVKHANTHAYLRADLSMPYVISDIMPPTEQVDGKFYTSKSAFRRVGRQLGLTEVGTEKLTHKVVRASSTRKAQEGRRNAIRKAIARVDAK
jgi:hypothetical protein